MKRFIFKHIAGIALILVFTGLVYAAGFYVLVRFLPSWHISPLQCIAANPSITDSKEIIPGEGSAVNGRTGKYGCSLAVLLWALGPAAMAAALAALYLRRYLFYPSAQLEKFLDTAESGRFVRLDENAGSSSWRPITLKLNRLGDKFYNATDTLHMLSSISGALTSRMDITEIFGIVMDIVRRNYNGASCAVIVLEEDGFLKIRSQRGLSPEFVRAAHLRPGEGFAGLSFDRCELTVVNDAAGQPSAAMADAIAREGIASYVHLPLVIDGKCEGILNVNSRDAQYFSADKIETLKNLAEYLGIAIRNIRLYERVQELNRRLETEVSSTTTELIQTNSRLIQKVREMKALSDIAAFAAAKANLPEILGMIVDKIKELLTAQAAGVFLYASESGELTPHAPFFGVRDRDFSNLRFKLKDVKALEDVVVNSRRYVINEPQEALEAVPLLANLLAVRSLALVPLRSGTKPVGVLGVANKLGTAFNQDDIRILELIADKISGIIENVTLYQQIGQRLRDLTALQEISSAISSEPVLEKTINNIILPTTRAFNADLCALLLFDERANELVTQPGAYFVGGNEAVLLRVRLDDPTSLSAQVFRSGEPFLSPDATIDPRVKSKTARLWNVRSLILVPLKAENRVIGVLRIGRHQANCYSKDHLRLAVLIAHQAAVIIENAHLYDSLREAKQEQERLNQVKNEFLSVVSHELRTPVTAIKGFVKLVLQGDAGKLNSQQEKFLMIADQSTDRLTVLISDLLDISKIEAGHMNIEVKPLDAIALIGEILQRLGPEISAKNITLSTVLPQSLPPVMADRERLIQVFDNLISNAIKFTPIRGKITVSAKDKGDCVVFGVKDTGIGIALKEQKKIFEKFYQVNSGSTRSVTGAGLGLAIVKSIVTMHGGHVWVESNPGKGAEFTFIIPRAKTEMQNFHQAQGALPE